MITGKELRQIQIKMGLRVISFESHSALQLYVLTKHILSVFKYSLSSSQSLSIYKLYILRFHGLSIHIFSAILFSAAVSSVASASISVYGFHFSCSSFSFLPLSIIFTASYNNFWTNKYRFLLCPRTAFVTRLECHPKRVVGGRVWCSGRFTCQ